MPIRRSKHTIREFVEALTPGTRVIWVANGGPGTVLPDKTILWDDGHHMTRNEMRDYHALLIHSEAERQQLRRALESRLKCLKSGCKLIHWDDERYNSAAPERLCPVAVLMVPKATPAPRPHEPRRKSGPPAPQTHAA